MKITHCKLKKKVQIKVNLALTDKDESEISEEHRLTLDEFKAIKNHSASFMRNLTARKKFINNHPKKLELARKIINARSNAKIITFLSYFTIYF